MRLSIITINYNNSAGLQKTIDSVVSQSFRDFEWIVIDGGSTDGSRELLEQYGEHISYWVSEPDKGIYNAMNKGVKVAKGEYLLFLNSGDCLCDVDVIADFHALKASEDIIAGNITVGGSIYNVRFSPDESEISYQYMCDSTILHPASFIKKELFDKYGGYDESLKIVSDWKFFFVCLIQYSCSYRKWERFISDFDTNGISENPESCTLIDSERERVKAEVLPYVYQTYQEMRRKILEQNTLLRSSAGKKLKSLLGRIIRKLSSLACINYLRIRKILMANKVGKKQPAKVIVSLTSWPKRIHNVPYVINSILQNTVKPDQIVLNLSEEEFPGKELDLPDVLMDFVNKRVLELLWTPGNLKAFKKFIPTMKKYPDDVIIAIDDDFIYPEDFIETFVTKHNECPNSPLSGNQVMLHGANAHCGCASLIKSAYFGSFIDDLFDEEVLKLEMDDVFYTYCAALNATYYQYVGKLFFMNMKSLNPIDSLSEGNKDKNNEMEYYLLRKIKLNYHIDMTKLHKPCFSFLER